MLTIGETGWGGVSELSVLPFSIFLNLKLF